jgi:hypothetical protein
MFQSNGVIKEIVQVVDEDVLQNQSSGKYFLSIHLTL